jgi:ABC-type bacteriocin/lantibiotic exporter with double-glycine peptidase domain
MFLGMGVFMPAVGRHTASKFKHVSAAMTVAEESITSIRAVKTFKREEKETERFLSEVDYGAKDESAIGVLLAFGMTIAMTLVDVSLIGNMYYASRLVIDGKLSAGDMVSVFGCSLMGKFGLLTFQGTLEGEQEAVAAGARILKLADQISTVPFEVGDEIENFKGHIEFRSVSFKYPTRDVYILRNVSFEVQPGEFAAAAANRRLSSCWNDFMTLKREQFCSTGATSRR